MERDTRSIFAFPEPSTVSDRQRAAIYSCVKDGRNEESTVKESKGFKYKIGKLKSNFPSFLQMAVGILKHKSVRVKC